MYIITILYNTYNIIILYHIIIIYIMYIKVIKGYKRNKILGKV